MCLASRSIKSTLGRKAELLSNQSVGFKRVPFFPAPVKELQQIISIDATWLDEDPYTLIINESV